MVQRLAPELRQAIDHLLTVPEGEQRSAFSTLKDYPPSRDHFLHTSLFATVSHRRRDGHRCV